LKKIKKNRLTAKKTGATMKKTEEEEE